MLTNPILVNVDNLKPYTYVDQKLKGIYSSKIQKSLQSIDSNHMEEKSNEKHRSLGLNRQ
jgi:putative cell wall-binding protein